MMDKVPNSSDSESYTPTSKAFGIYLFLSVESIIDIISIHCTQVHLINPQWSDCVNTSVDRCS
jgi:hypothetical protein